MHFQGLASYDQSSVECLDDNAASEFVAGSLSGPAASRVEGHLAGCRDCRALVAALAGAGDVDSQAETRQRERVTESQAGKLPRKYAVGDRVGRYLVLSTLGAGGMGVVLSAYDPHLDRKVALKLLRANLGANAKDARVRLKREAQAIAQLSHPNVVGVYDVGTTDEGDVYIAMEFVEGDTLTTWCKRWPRTWREILEVFHQAARGLMAAHGVGLLHRDFKPDNVLVGGDGRVRVTDFGLARSVLGPDDPQRPKPESSPLHTELTATGTVLGTPRYMPPEQLTGPEIDARADQFSFCVALYEALFGTHPLPGATSVSMLEHNDEALPPPDNTRVPAAITRAVMRGLQRERIKRFPTMSALMSELVPPVQRSPVRYLAAAALAVVIIGGATAAVVTRPEPIRRIDPPDDGPFVQQIKELTAQRDRLEAQIEELIKRNNTTKDELQAVKQELDTVNARYNKALDELARRRALDPGKAAAGKVASQITNIQISAALSAADRNLEGCFDEWYQRQALDAIEVVKRPAPKDAQLAVDLGVTPDGIGHDAIAKGELDAARDGSLTRVHGTLSFCVEDAIKRVAFPKGPEALDVTVQVAWEAPGIVNTSGRVVGRHEASSHTVDMQ
jgi:serine/threonine protein kinase